MNLWKMWKKCWFKREKINKRGVFCMKKRMILLVLLFGVVSFSKTGVVGTQTRSKNNFSTKIISVKNEESAVNKAFEKYIGNFKNPENIRQQYTEKNRENSTKKTDEIVGSSVSKSDREGLKKIDNLVTNKTNENTINYLIKANEKISYKILNTEIKGNQAILTVHMKAPNFAAYMDEMENYIKKYINQNSVKIKQMTEREYQESILEKMTEFFLELSGRNNIQYLEGDVKVFAEKVGNEWRLVEDYKVNNDFYRYISFGVALNVVD